MRLLGRARSGAILALLFGAAALGPAEAQLVRMDAIRWSLIVRSGEPFGGSTTLAPAGPLWVKWRALADSLASEAAELARCRAEPATCTASAPRLIDIIAQARLLDGRRKLAAVQQAVNLALRYSSDSEQHGAPDVWLTPLAAFASGRGDCEDYAIAKFLALREAGVAPADLRILITHNRADLSAHAVLAVRQEERWIILDNRRMGAIEDRHLLDLDPLYALDDTGVRQFHPSPQRDLAAAADASAAEALPSRP